MTVTGIDISHWQGAIDWAQVNANPDIGFVIMKATEGRAFVDDQFERNWKNCTKPKAAYHFWRYADDPNAQAVHFDAVVRAIAGNVKVRPVFDYEDKNAPKLGNIYSNIKEFHDRAQSLFDGRTPLVYTAGWWWDPWIGKDLFGSNPLWVAHYTTAPGPTLPKTGGWTEWRIWQYTSSGRAAGIDGNVDTNRFNGTQADANAFFYFADAPVPPPPPPPAGDWDEARVKALEDRASAVEAKLAAAKEAL